MKFRSIHTAISLLTCLLTHSVAADGYLDEVPETAPRTWVLADAHEAFKTFVTQGGGEKTFAGIKRDFDAHWMDFDFPEEPDYYGDPDPRQRTSEQVDKWRGLQDLTGQISGVAEAATLIWLATGDETYLEKAREFLLKSTEWDPNGVSGIDYNDEANFRLFRKMPLVYDQLRNELTAEEQKKVVEHLRTRGIRSVEWIKGSGIEEVERNSIRKTPSSHPVRFMAMVGQAGLALWDDVPEARDWFAFSYEWYRDAFTPWGGDDGGWAEGPAYWRGVYEHAIFQDALINIGAEAYDSPFWENTGYFQLYFTQPYFATAFGDLSNAGRFNMEPGVKHFLQHLARVLEDGHLLSYTELYEDSRPLPNEAGMKNLYRTYPTTAEYLIRDFIGSKFDLPESKPLTELPQSRHFKDIGWVSMHSALGQPEADIQLSFKSSPYGSFSHSHADQNSFIINAFGEGLAINSGYREYHRSRHHRLYTRETRSKNNILIEGQGQRTQDKNARGKITRFETEERYVWTTGDATEAFNTLQVPGNVVKAVRDIVFVDNRYFVIRDHVQLKNLGMVDWLLHAEQPITYDEASNTILIENNDTFLITHLVHNGSELDISTWTGFPIPVDPKYKDPTFISTQAFLLRTADDQGHLAARTVDDSGNHIFHAVLWPSQERGDAERMKIELEEDGLLKIQRPDGKVDRIRLSGEQLVIE